MSSERLDSDANVNDNEIIDRLRKENAQLKERLAQASIVAEPSGDGWDYLRIPTKTVLLLDLLDGELEVDEDKLEEVMKYADKQEQVFMVYKYSELINGENLQQHVSRMNASQKCPGPYDEETMVYSSKRWMTVSQLPNIEITRKMLAMWWRGGYWKFWREADKEHTQHTALHQSQEWNAFLKNCMLGNFQPYAILALNNGAPEKHQAQAVHIINAPIVIRTKEGKKHWGHIRQGTGVQRNDYHDTFMRYIHFVKNTPVCMTVVLAETGAILHQNHASMATFGNHGPFNLVHLKDGNEKRRKLAFPPSSSEDASEDGLSFLELLFLGSDDLERMRGTKINGLFSTRVEIKSQRLKSWMQLGPDEEAYHDLRSMIIQDPNTFASIYILTHIDVTDTVLAQKAVMKANDELAEEKIRMDALLKRQYDLIEMLKTMPGHSFGATTGDARESVRDKVSFLHDALAEAGAVSPAEADDIKLLTVLGQGTFGTVYLGEWRGAAVAVKRIVLPAAMSNSERAQKMAIMEIAISSSMFHPNLVQTYTYSIKQLRDQEGDDGLKLVGGSGSHINAHEMRLVLEYCDKGSLSAHAKHFQGIRDASGALQYANLIETAADIARAMLHLHKNDICHNDLKAANVLLKSEGTDGRGVRAKVMDFGLSIKLDSKATHVSNLFQGTVTHMAPEVLMEGKQSKSADVYAFGLTLWEIVSGGSAYKGIPQMALGQLIVFKHKRPAFPKDTPPAFRAIAERCWHPKATSRPNFQAILDELQRIKASIAEKPGAWPVVPSSSLGPATSGTLTGPLNTQGDDRDSPIQPLETAQCISQSSSVDMFENWVPTILGDDKVGSKVGSKIASAHFSEQVTYVEPPQMLDKAPSNPSETLTFNDSISLKNPSSCRPSVNSQDLPNSSGTSSSKGKESNGTAKDSRVTLMDSSSSTRVSLKKATTTALVFRTVQSINEEQSNSPPESNNKFKIMRMTSGAISEAAPSPQPTLSPLSPPLRRTPPKSPIKLSLGDLNKANESNSNRLSEKVSQMPVMTMKLSIQPPSLEPWLTTASSAPLDHEAGPSHGHFAPIQEETLMEYSETPTSLFERLQKAGNRSQAQKDITVMSPASIDYNKSYQGDSPFVGKPSVSFHEPGASQAGPRGRMSGAGSGRGWLSFFSPSSSAGISRAGSIDAGSGSASSKAVGLSSRQRDAVGGSGSFRRDKSMGRSQSFKGSLSRLLNVVRRLGPDSIGSASTAYSKDQAPLAPGEARRTSDPTAARGPSSSTLAMPIGGSVVDQRSQSMEAKTIKSGRSFLGLKFFKRKSGKH